MKSFHCSPWSRFAGGTTETTVNEVGPVVQSASRLPQGANRSMPPFTLSTFGSTQRIVKVIVCCSPPGGTTGGLRERAVSQPICPEAAGTTDDPRLMRKLDCGSSEGWDTVNGNELVEKEGPLAKKSDGS